MKLDKQDIAILSELQHDATLSSTTLAERTNVERDATLSLRALHAIVEDAGLQHGPQASPQHLRIQLRVPGAHGLMRIVEDPDQFLGERNRGADGCVDRQTVNRTRGREAHITEVRRLARTRGHGRHMQTRC